MTIAVEGNPNTSQKVADMAQLITGHTLGAKLRRVYSLPCTYHNFVAVLGSWEVEDVQVDEVGILTNAYHLARAQELADRAAKDSERFQRVGFVPIAAEAFLGVDVTTVIGSRLDEYRARIESEARGLEQLRLGTYQDSCSSQNLDLLRPAPPITQPSSGVH